MKTLYVNYLYNFVLFYLASKNIDLSLQNFIVMKKLFLTISVFIFLGNTFCQTIQNEEKNINSIIQSKAKSQDAITALASDWKKFLIDYGTFPTLPYNTNNNEIEYIFIKSYELNKDIILNRILEWGALNFGSLDAVLHYKSIESGKLILKGRFPIVHREDFINFWGNKKETLDTKECVQTYTFTIKNNKLKIQISNISYEYSTSSYIINNTYYPAHNFNFDLSSLYPITNYDKSKWKENLNILEQTNNSINSLVSDLDTYIKDYVNDYSY